MIGKLKNKLFFTFNMYLPNIFFKSALSTYHSQQTMTLDILHHLHKSLETCPAPTILADDPSGLKVELMLHQKYAIAWLMWRENQKPHGGILGK